MKCILKEIPSLGNIRSKNSLELFMGLASFISNSSLMHLQWITKWFHYSFCNITTSLLSSFRTLKECITYLCFTCGLCFLLYVPACIHVLLCMSTCVCICMCVYTHTHIYFVYSVFPNTMWMCEGCVPTWSVYVNMHVFMCVRVFLWACHIE